MIHPLAGKVALAALISGAGGAWLAAWPWDGPDARLQAAGARSAERPTDRAGGRRSAGSELLHSELVPIALVTRGSRDALRVQARSTSLVDRPLFVVHSVAVHDDDDQELIPPQRTGKNRLSARDQRMTQEFEIPEGLPDGYHYAELLVAYATSPDDQPLVKSHHLYFRITGGALEILDTIQWAHHVNARPAAIGGE